VASYVGETLTAGGNVTAVEGYTITIDVYIKNGDGDVIAPGVATAEINA